MTCLRIFKAQSDQTDCDLATRLAKLGRNIQVHTLLERGVEYDRELFDKFGKTAFALQLLDYSRDWTGNIAPDDGGHVYLTTELGARNLEVYLREQRKMSEQMKVHMAHKILLAAAFLNAKGLVHMDIKPSNIMEFQSDRGSTWKLIDLDGCMLLGSQLSVDDGVASFTPIYCAPEMCKFLLDRNVKVVATPQLDSWSVGLTLCQLVTGGFPFQVPDERGFVRWVASTEHVPLGFVKENSVQISDIAEGLLLCDEQRRKTSAQCAKDFDFYKDNAELS